MDNTDQKYAELLQRSDATCKALIELLGNISELMRGEVDGYAKQVADHSLVLAISMGLVKPETHHIYYAGLLHEIGLFCVSPRLHMELHEKNISASEKLLLQQVPQMGYLSLMAVDVLRPVAEIILQHQEYLDGSGYPKGLKQDQISMASQLLAVVVDYHKILSGKFFQAAVEPTDAFSYINERSGVLYNADIVQQFSNILSFEDKPQPKNHNAINSTQLKPGMILAKALFSADGLELLPRCRVLNQQDINAISNVENTAGKQLEIFVMNTKSQQFDNPFMQADLDLKDISILLGDNDLKDL
jgi:response regulator RpfG family c-di-GMP phosphodiesterase